MSIESIAAAFIESMSSRYDLRIGKEFHREKANCAWFSKEFFEWCKKRGIECRLAYFDHPHEAHIAPVIAGKTVDFTVKQFTKDPADDYLILDPEEYSKWGYCEFEILRSIPDWATIRPADLIREMKSFRRLKHLKLFESFGFEDVLEDIKWILIEMSEGAKLYRHEKDYCMIYELPGSIDVEGVESAKGRLDELGFDLVYLGTPAIATRDIQGKQICWIVKSEFFRGPYLGNVDRDSLPTRNGEYRAIPALQNNILLEMWKKKPEIDNDRLGALMIFNHKQVAKADEWFREFLGPNAKEIVNSLVKPGDRHRIQKGGYDFEISVEEIKIAAGSEYVDIHCEVLKGGEVTIFSEEDQPTLSLEEATENESYGWEIENEIRDCIEDYFYTAIGIRNKTGYSIDAVDWTFE